MLIALVPTLENSTEPTQMEGDFEGRTRQLLADIVTYLLKILHKALLKQIEARDPKE
jgi:hypothetical protein